MGGKLRLSTDKAMQKLKFLDQVLKQNLEHQNFEDHFKANKAFMRD